MSILFYQIGIFLAILIASIFGQKSRNTAVIVISIFTVLQIYVDWLLILQFITILVAYHISNSISSEEKTKKDTNNLEQFLHSDYGLSKNNPVLLIDTLTSYKYINQLNTFNKNLSYKRIGNTQSNKFENMIEIYEFRKSNIFLCNVYVYPFAQQNIIEIPKPFRKI